ncbi:MAG TPA: aminomethyl-transferring glycine dehydrogenase subunit GcvPB, partial [Gammaproteobacteria bacterium]|nr:aminomethyl-transferring glycine dehydrogenase subunit GcvPB [Gammaproteobacteria bacterium]
VKILKEAQTQPELLKQAPHTLPVKRLDEVKAARELDVVYHPKNHNTNEEALTALG